TRSNGWIYLFLWVTALGKEVVVISLAIVLSVILWFYRKQAEILGLWLALLGAGIFVILGKAVFQYARPGGWIPFYFENSNSFPSGHAALALAFYGFLGVIALHDFKKYWAQILAVGSAAFLIFAISWSRLYLGVHFPSDILAGLLVGGLWFYVGDAALRTGFFSRELNPPQTTGKAKHWISAILILWWFFFFAVYTLNWHVGLAINQ
ncbi:MAG: phosphatase PAP2 family protein, partial [Patescibacteria group bacterium]